MYFMDNKNVLGLPPMELAENRDPVAAQRISPSNTLMRRLKALFSDKYCNIFILTILVIILVSMVAVFSKKDTKKEVHKTEVLLATGQRESTNVTNSADMTVFLQIKNESNKTFEFVSRKKRNLIRKRVRQERSIFRSQGIKKLDIERARKVIINHDEICDPENRNEFCKNILRKLNVSIFNEIENPETEFRQFRDTNLGESDKTVASLHDNQDFSHGVPTGAGEGFFQNDRSLHISNNFESYRTPYSQETLPYGNVQPPQQGDCLLSRLMSQNNFGQTGPLNYYGVPNQQYFPINAYNRPSLPFTQTGYFNPPYYQGPYTSYQNALPPFRETVSSALDQGLHPTNQYKTSITELQQRSSSRASSCSEDMTPCAGEDVCVENKRWCDGFVDCVDASDELVCSCKARVDKTRLCDGYYDCPFGEDEMGCFGCDEHEYSCDDVDLSSRSTCFKKEHRCDGIVQCPNRKDELECNMLTPSVNEKPIFSISHTEGFLHRNYKGKWYPVCERPYMWAHDVCRQETNLLLRPPLIQMLRIDPFFKGQYINNVHGELSQISDSCFNASAVYVTCQDLLCGTRVLTEPQMSREDSQRENHLYGRNKREIFSKLSQASNKESIETQSPEYNDDKLSESIVKYESDEENQSPTREFNIDGRYKDSRAEYIYSDGRGKRAESRVVGGKPSQPGSWPWMIAIFKDGIFHCGGVIVSNRWIVSAAHCVHQYWDHYYEVQVGMVRRFSFSPQERTHKVTHIVINGNYNRGKMINDLSLLRVSPEVQYSRWVRPICLPEPGSAGPSWLWGPAPGTTCVAVGWGATAEHGPDPDHMREVEVPVWESCKHRDDIVGNEICAGPVEGGKDACQGDSGGPLLCKSSVNSQQWYVAGIVSHGDGCARKGEPGVYTRVSLFTDWIYFQIGSTNLPMLQPKQECPGFRCASGILKCLPKVRKCDKEIDCLDGEDEVNCNFIRNSFDDDDESLLIARTTEQSKNMEGILKIDNNKYISNHITASKSNETVNEIAQSKVLHKNGQRTQKQHGSNFLSDTEDLMINRTRIMYGNTTKSVTKFPKKNTSDWIKTKQNQFEDITTAKSVNSNVDDRDLESAMKRITSKVATAMGESKKYDKGFFVNKPFKHENSKKYFNERQNGGSSSEESFTHDPISLSTDIRSLFKSDLDQNTITETPLINSQNKVVIAKQNVSNFLPNNKTDAIFTNQSISQDKHLNFSNWNLLNNTAIRGNITKLNVSTGNEKFSKQFLHNNTLPEETKSLDTKDKNINQTEETSKQLPHTTTEVPLADVTQSPETKGLPIETSTHSGMSSTLSPSSTTAVHEEAKIIGSHTKILNNAHAKRKILRPNFFECVKIPQTIQSSLRCNHQADCEDGTDELECTCVDYLTTFNSKMLCDGFLDCPDGSDELECYTCDPDQFLCKWSKMCLPYEYVCDGISHCPGGEDELDCFTLTDGEQMTYDVDGRPSVNMQGFLTKRFHKSWNIVCEDRPNIDRQIEAATDICHYLGFSGYDEFKIKHINIPVEPKDRTFYGKSRSNRAVQREKVQIVYQSTKEDSDIVAKVLEDPVVLPTHCVPNVSKTCVTLYVNCYPTLNSDISSHKLIPTRSESSREATKTSNEIIKHNTEYLWPWAAKVFAEGVYRCTGVLVDLSWVLISSSCLWDTLLNKDFVCVVLGGKRNLVTTSSPFEHTLEVDGKKEIYDSQVTLLHLKKPAELSRMVKPMVLPNINMHRTDSDTCVTVGQGLDNHTVTVLLDEIDSNCGRKNKCFVRHDSGPHCQNPTYLGQPWAGIISCKGADGGEWYPAASYVEIKGECGFQDQVAAISLAHIRTDINSTIARSIKDLHFSEYETPECAGVRCEHGACIPLMRLCDHVSDCNDGRDELPTACEKKQMFCSIDPYVAECACNSGQLKCRNGQCIGKQMFGNGVDDCGDGSDEPPTTTCAHYLARVAPHRLCDGHLQCFDRSDEDPNFCKCFSTKTQRCPKSGTCVAVDLVCDGVPDCPHGEDESTCMGLAAPAGTPHGTGEVLERRFGVWHTKCYHKPNHTKSELEKICRGLGYNGGHALLLKTNVLPSINPFTNILLDEFRKVILNDQTTISLRNSDRPLAKAIVDEAAEKCYPVFIECV